MKRWYLVHTKPRKEKLAQANLQRQDWEVYLPLLLSRRRRRGAWAEAVEPLFKPGDKVVIDKSPMADLQAIFVASTSEERVVVLLDLLGKKNRVTLKPDLLRPA